MTLLSLILNFAGLGALALTLHAHRKRVFAHVSCAPRAITLQTVGIVLLAMSLMLDLWHNGPSLGTITFVATASIGGFALALLLAFRPRLCALPFVSLDTARLRKHCARTGKQSAG